MSEPVTNVDRTIRAMRARCRTSDVRAWALANGIEVARHGGLPRFVYDLYLDAQAAVGPRRSTFLDETFSSGESER